ncbi:MAG: glycosyltransferase family A protein [Chitinophagaceae bacterium]
MPSFNRGEGLYRIIKTILQCDVSEFTAVEIIVVDDGSSVPAEPFLSKLTIPAPFTLRPIRQENAGPAAARNNGFRQATHEVVLFMDDDILAFPDMLKKHMEGHTKFPGSVIYGYCPYTIPEKKRPAYLFLESLTRVNEEDVKNNRFVPTTSVASGNISVEKKNFPDGEFYKSSLRTPAAEEFELMARLASRGIKTYFNPSIKGWHLQLTTIEDKCKQEYKYGIGVAEVALKVPYSLDHANLQSLYYDNREISKNDSGSVKFKKRVKSVVSKKWCRQFLLKMVKGMEVVLPFRVILFPFYRLLAGIYVFAGVKDGLKKFGNSGTNS